MVSTSSSPAARLISDSIAGSDSSTERVSFSASGCSYELSMSTTMRAVVGMAAAVPGPAGWLHVHPRLLEPARDRVGPARARPALAQPPPARRPVVLHPAVLQRAVVVDERVRGTRVAVERHPDRPGVDQL